MARKVRNAQGVHFRHSPPRAVLFGAVSTGQQAETDKSSLKDQFEALNRYAVSQDWEVIDTIEVPGFSRDFYTFADFCDDAEKEHITAPRRMYQHWREADFDVLCVLNMSRLGREEGIIHDFVGRTYGIGAYIYTDKNGLIAPENRRMVTMIEAYGSKSEIDELMRRYKAGMINRINQGKLSSKAVPHFHRVKYDEAGKQVLQTGQDGALYYLIVNRDKQTELDALYHLIVHQHLAASRVDMPMADLGYRDAKGEPHYDGFYVQEVWKPAFHGHIGLGVRAPHMPYRARWMMSRLYASEVPSGVHMAYDVAEPAYEPARLKEFQRVLLEGKTFKGRSQSFRLNMFTGLGLCAECGSGLSYIHKKGSPLTQQYYRCNMAYTTPGYIICSNRHSVRQDAIQHFVGKLIDEFLAAPQESPVYLSHVLPPNPKDALGRHVEKLEQELAAVEKFIRGSSDMSAATATRLTNEMNRLTSQLEQAQTEFHALASSYARSELDTANLLSPDFHAQLRHLWDLPPTEINHILRRFLGDWRFTVRDGQPVGWEIVG